MFKPTFLYVKTHNATGLKYFGKTIRTNPHKYKGSGTFWNRHLAVHGYDVTTEIIGYFTDEVLCKHIALDFSVKHDIVKSRDWANLKFEKLDGGWDHITIDDIKRSVETFNRRPKVERNKINKSKGQKGSNNFWYGKNRSAENNPRFGITLSEDQRARQRQKMIGKRLGKLADGTIIHVSVDDPRFLQGILSSPTKGRMVVKDCIGNTFSVDKSDLRVASGELVHINKGRIRTDAEKSNLSAAVKQLKWYNNGQINVRKANHPGKDWLPGRK